MLMSTSIRSPVFHISCCFVPIIFPIIFQFSHHVPIFPILSDMFPIILLWLSYNDWCFPGKKDEIMIQIILPSDNFPNCVPSSILGCHAAMPSWDPFFGGKIDANKLGVYWWILLYINMVYQKHQYMGTYIWIYIYMYIHISIYIHIYCMVCIDS